jgi:hypothetical protein
VPFAFYRSPNTPFPNPPLRAAKVKGKFDLVKFILTYLLVKTPFLYFQRTNPLPYLRAAKVSTFNHYANYLALNSLLYS